MLNIKICMNIVSAFILLFVVSNPAVAQPGNAEEAQNLIEALTPGQQSAVASELSKTGGVVTPDTIKSLKGNPELKGLTPEEIARGREMLEKKNPDGEPVDKEGKEGVGNAPSTSQETLLFDRYRVVGSYQDISTRLLPFGYEFFSGTDGRVLVPRKDIPVSADYIIGPGDEVRIMLWGRVNAQYNLVVDKDGNIAVPQIGPLQVNGMRFDEMKRYLADQSDQIVGAKINVTLGDMKSIQVFVLGEVVRPGSYALDSFSTITTALLSAGGPTGIGSFRHIQLKRDNKTVTDMDFYDFLMKGDKSDDRVLQSGDVVFVPTAGPLVGIAGNVRRPAVYELDREYYLGSLFEMAGGLIPAAYTQQIQVERIQKGKRQIVIDIDDSGLSESGEFRLQDGDLVKVFSIVDKDVNAVYLYGNLKRPGKYEYKDSLRVGDLITGPNDLKKETYFNYALIKRLRPPGLGTELIPFNLGKLLLEKNMGENIALKPQDSVYVFSKWLFRDKPTVSVNGEVRKMGTFELLENHRIKDIIYEAGGLTKDASLDKGEIFRTGDQGDVSQIYFSVGLAMAEDPKENLLLRDSDRIVIHSLWEDRQRPTVSIEGAIKNSGTYPLAKGMRVSDLIFSAGNVLESAYLAEAEVSSFDIEQGKKVKVSYRTIDLAGALDGKESENVLLKPYDRVFVKNIPEWKEKNFVNLSGEIMFPGRYIIKKGERLSSILERAGGYSDNAYLRGAVFTRSSVQDVQKKSIAEMLNRLERELFSTGAVQASAALSKEEVEAKRLELEQKKKFIETLRNLKPSGRMTIGLSHLRLLKNSEYDIALEDGDSLFIPARPDVVHVIGSVMSQGSFVFSKEMDYRNYIEIAGGLSPYADEKNIYVIKADGSARKVPSNLINWNLVRSRWEVKGFGGDHPMLEPGDSIVVPEKLDRFAWMREVKDITQILYQIAVTAGVLIVAF